MRRRVVLVILILVGLVLVYRPMKREDSTTAGRAAPPNTASAAPAPTSSPTATGPDQLAAATPTPSPQVAVPDVVGMRLTGAAQVLAGAGFTDVLPVDASGSGRLVVNPLNWIVQGQDPPAGHAVPVGTRVTLRVGKPSDGAGDDRITVGVVPDVRCTDLHTGRDRLGLAGFTNVSAEDGLGRGRIPMIEGNWVVIAQSVPAGSRPAAGTTVALTVVKFGESTGSSGCRS